MIVAIDCGMDKAKRNKEECKNYQQTHYIVPPLSFDSHTKPNQKRATNGVLDFGVFGIPFVGLAYTILPRKGYCV
jgi:hypothetical protein